MGQNDTSAATFDLNGRDQTIGGVILSTTGGNKLITNLDSATRATLTINNATDRTYGGAATPQSLGLIAGNLNLTKAGAGTLTLSSANTYTGATTVSGGTLALRGASERLPDASPMTLAGGRFNDRRF